LGHETEAYSFRWSVTTCSVLAALLIAARLWGLAARVSGLAFGLALAVRPRGSVSGA